MALPALELHAVPVATILAACIPSITMLLDVSLVGLVNGRVSHMRPNLLPSRLIASWDHMQARAHPNMTAHSPSASHPLKDTRSLPHPLALGPSSTLAGRLICLSTVLARCNPLT